MGIFSVAALPQAAQIAAALPTAMTTAPLVNPAADLNTRMMSQVEFLYIRTLKSSRAIVIKSEI